MFGAVFTPDWSRNLEKGYLVNHGAWGAQALLSGLGALVISSAYLEPDTRRSARQQPPPTPSPSTRR